MSGQKQLSGLSVLIVEDDFLIAEDARHALQQAGAGVIGPCPDLDSARALIGQEKPDCAVLDINLGEGADFTAAREMLEQKIKVVFATGYDSGVIPPELVQLKCLQKPITGRRLVSAVAELCDR